MSLEFEPDFSCYAHLKVIGIGNNCLEIMNLLAEEPTNPEVPLVEFAVIGNSNTAVNPMIVQLKESSNEQIEHFLRDCDLLTLCIDTRDKNEFEVLEQISNIVQNEICTVTIVVHGNGDIATVATIDTMKIMINRDEKPFCCSYQKDVIKAIHCYADGILQHGLFGVDYADYKNVIDHSKTAHFCYFTLDPELHTFETCLHDIRSFFNDNDSFKNPIGAMITISNYLEYGLLEIETIHQLVNDFMSEDTNKIVSIPSQPAVQGDLEVSILFTY